MASYTVKFQSIINGKTGSGMSSTGVTATSEREARQKFKMSHDPSKYKIIAVVKIG
jgi:hypothetical protein